MQRLNKSKALSFSPTGYYFYTLRGGILACWVKRIIDQDGTMNYSKIISINNASSKAVQLYPVPAGNTISIQLVDAKYLGTEAVIMDNAGKIIRRLKISSLLQNTDISRLASGTYFLQLKYRRAIKFQKL